jgi:hypothetical protein
MPINEKFRVISVEWQNNIRIYHLYTFQLKIIFFEFIKYKNCHIEFYMTIDENDSDSEEEQEQEMTFIYSYEENPLICPIENIEEDEYTDCAICYEPFIFPKPLRESLDEYKCEVVDKITTIFIEENIESKRIKKHVYYKMLRSYYQRLWLPHYKGYECSTAGCHIRICKRCYNQLVDDEPFQCTHCRNIDWKLYMTKRVIPIAVGVALGRMGPPEHRIPFKLIGLIAY